MNRRVVVTGLGLVTPVGNSVETTWAALLEGRSGADYIKKFDTEKFPVRFACEVKDFDPLNYIEKKEARKMGAFIHYAVAASQEAVNDSGLQITDEIAENVGSTAQLALASMAVAITTFHSVSASAVTIIFLMPMTMVCMSSRVVIRIGHRYWFQP